MVLPSNSKLAVAAAVGKLVAERALASGITQVVFDRGGYKFHGRVKALAEASREGGLPILRVDLKFDNGVQI